VDWYREGAERNQWRGWSIRDRLGRECSEKGVPVREIEITE